MNLGGALGTLDFGAVVASVNALASQAFVVAFIVAVLAIMVFERAGKAVVNVLAHISSKVTGSAYDTEEGHE